MSDDVELYRDKKWRREEHLRLRSAQDVEAMVEELGFCFALTDVRTEFPSVFVGVCGRREAHSPKNVQKDEEMSLAWVLKDEVMRRGNVYYSKLLKGRATFVSKELVPYFYALCGIPKSREKTVFTPESRRILSVLRTEWESSTADLRLDAKIEDRKILTKSMEELQRAMKVIPYDVVYKPKFTYLWTLAEARFPEQLNRRVRPKTAMIEIARAYLSTYGYTGKGQFSKNMGFGRKESGLAFHALVDEGFAKRLGEGEYKLANFAEE